MLAPVNLSGESRLKQMLLDNYTLKSEDEHYIVSGGTGYNNKVRVLGDFGSRLYYIVRVKKSR